MSTELKIILDEKSYRAKIIKLVLKTIGSMSLRWIRVSARDNRIAPPYLALTFPTIPIQRAICTKP